MLQKVYSMSLKHIFPCSLLQLLGKFDIKAEIFVGGGGGVADDLQPTLSEVIKDLVNH